MRRVVITGIGLVTPLGCGAGDVWANLLAGKNGAKRVTDFDVSDIACQIGCFIPRGSGRGEFNPDDWMEPKEQRKVDDFIVYAISAADQALADAGWAPKTEDERVRSGVLIGSGIGGLQGIERGAMVLHEKGPRQAQPILYSRTPYQSGFGLRVDQARSEGAEPLGCHRLLDRSTRHRRRLPSDRSRRCRRHDRRRNGKPALPSCLGRLRLLPRSFDAFQ